MELYAYDPLTADHDEQMADEGCLYRYKKGIIIRYVKVEDADLVAGDPVYYASATGNEVTRDVSGGSRIGNKACGIAIASVTDGNWGYIQVSGNGLVALTFNSGDGSAGDHLMGDTSNDGKIASGTLGTDDGQWIGIAHAASSSSVLAAGAYTLFGMI